MERKKLPGWIVTLILIGALLYLVFPRDVIPDFIPVVGLTEDFLLMAFVLYLFWRRKREREGSAGGHAGWGHYSQPGPDGERQGSPQAEEDPYEVLGVSPSDSPDTIRRKYHKLISKYHPDKVNDLGDEFKEMAAQRTVAINRAYQRIRS